MAQYLNNGVVSREFVYNARGERVGKKVPGSPGSDTYFVYDEGGHLIGEYRGSGSRIREYVWLDDVPVAVFASHAGTTYQYILTDHLNTPRAVALPTTDTIVWRWDLTGSAFGDHAVAANPDGDATSYTLPLRYPGQYHDTETGLFQNYFRDYDPSTGRYLQSDPIGQFGGVNTFGYVGAQPFSFSDSLGLAKDQACVASFIASGAVCGGAIGSTAGAVIGGAGGALACSPSGPGAAVCAGAGGAAMSPVGGGIGATIGGLIGGAAAEAACPDADPCKGIRKQLEKHKRKLQEYIANPAAHDNQGKLGRGNDAQEIAWRIASLQKQIAQWERELAKCEANRGR